MALTRRLTRQIDVSDFSLRELMYFVSGWSPTWPDDRRGPWLTWHEFLRDYVALRPQLTAKFRSGPRASFEPMFADRVVTFRAKHGAAALDAATSEQIRAVDGRGPSARRSQTTSGTPEGAVCSACTTSGVVQMRLDAQPS